MTEKSKFGVGRKGDVVSIVVPVDVAAAVKTAAEIMVLQMLRPGLGEHLAASGMDTMQSAVLMAEASFNLRALAKGLESILPEYTDAPKAAV